VIAVSLPGRGLRWWLLSLIILVVVPSGDAIRAQSGGIPLHQDADLLFTVDPDGTAGFQLVNWSREGLFTGVRVSMVRPEGERVSWSAHMAEVQMESTFRGYGREQYVGLYGGFAFLQKSNRTVLAFGTGIVREQRFRKYYDEDQGPGHEIYYMRDDMKQRYLVDLLLGVYHRGRELHVGLGFSLATRSINLIFGFPISLQTLRHG
jgi:hypothetical protein